MKACLVDMRERVPGQARVLFGTIDPVGSAGYKVRKRHDPNFLPASGKEYLENLNVIHSFMMYYGTMQQDANNYKELLKGTIGPIILRLLNEHTRMYGYEITAKVKEMSEGKVQIKEGSLYPALHKLESDGLIVSEEVFIGKRVRRYYKLTGPGKKAARASVDELVDFLRTIYGLITAEPLKVYVAT